jgi:hypothetical protein
MSTLTKMRMTRLSLLIVPLLWLTVSRAASAATVDFDSFPPNVPAFANGAPLSVQYGSLGVIFDYPSPSDAPRILAPTSPAPSSGAYLAVGPDFAHELNDLEFRIKFSSAQRSVQMRAATSCTGATGTLTAYGEGGLEVLDVDSQLLGTGATSVLLSVATTTAVIREVVVRAVPALGSNPCNEFIDDLSFEGDPPPVPGAPPAIVLSAPTSGDSDRTQVALTATGTVSGSSLWPNVYIYLVSLDTPSGQPTTESFFTFLTQDQGTGIPFSRLLRSAGGLPIGHYRVEALVQDKTGQQAQASVTFANIPPISPDPSLGAFRFSVLEQNCQMLFYQNGTVAYFPGGSPQTRAVPTVIAEKWRTVNSPILGPQRTLGCPIADPDISVQTWTAQDFERGRIYAPTVGAARYVPRVLTEAIDKVAHPPSDLAKEFYQVGWPVADPEWALLSEDPVWVFQRFAQNDLGPASWNTLEIRGRTPFLYVERVGGDVQELVEAKIVRLDDSSKPYVDGSTPTQWLQFPCTRPAGGGAGAWPTECDLSTMVHPPYVPPERGFDGGYVCGAQFRCGNAVFKPGLTYHCDTETADGTPICPTFTVPVALPVGSELGIAWGDLNGNANFDPRVFEGFVKQSGSFLAEVDHPLVHDHCNSLPYCLDPNSGAQEALATAISITTCPGSWLTGGLIPCIDPVSRAVTAACCRSDWNLHTRPLPARKNWEFLSEPNIDPMSAPNLDPNVDFEIEFEVRYADRYFQRFSPLAGDLLAIHGRQIIDCAHCPYNAEIHPVDMMVVSRSFVSQPISNIDPARGTEAYLWVNGFFPNGVDIPVVVYPPPRPSPFSRLKFQQHETGYYVSNSDFVHTDIREIGVGMQVTFSTSLVPTFDADHSGQWHYPDPETAAAHFVDHWRLSWTVP